MANRFMDSCDHYAAGDILTKYSSIGATAPTIGTGRTVNGLSFNGSSAASNAIIVLGAQSTWIVGCAFKYSSAGSILALLLGTGFQTGIMVNTSGTIQFHDDALNGIGFPSVVTVTSGTWNYIELQATIATAISAGTALVKLNGVTILTLTTGERTNYSNGTTADAVCFGQWSWLRFSGNFVGILDDIYINDTTGSFDNTFWGDITVDALFTSVAGTYQDMSITGTSTSVLATTDRAPDGDSTYVYSNTTNDRESFTFTTPAFSILTVKGVQFLNYAKKVGSGTRTLTPFTRVGITNYDQSAAALSTSYGYTKALVRLNPATGLVWTESDILAIEAGAKVTS